MDKYTDTIDLLPVVRFRHLPRAFLVLLATLLDIEKRFASRAFITGASFEDYPKGGLHDKGWAWDIRTRDIEDKLGYVCAIRTALLAQSENFRVVYGDKMHTDHIHVEYQTVGSDK